MQVREPQEHRGDGPAHVWNAVGPKPPPLEDPGAVSAGHVPLRPVEHPQRLLERVIAMAMSQCEGLDSLGNALRVDRVHAVVEVLGSAVSPEEMFAVESEP